MIRLAAALLALTLGSAHAADTSPPPAPKPAAADKLATARALLAQKNVAGAITELQRVNDAGSADWNNLMGFSLRKSATPDYAAAGRYYDEALRINPQHLSLIHI